MKYLILTGLLIAGCSAEDTNTQTSATGGADTCNAAAYQNLIGQDAVTALIIPDPKRVFRLGEPVTQDYVAERVNVRLDDTDVIIAVGCG